MYCVRLYLAPGIKSSPQQCSKLLTGTIVIATLLQPTHVIVSCVGDGDGGGESAWW